MFVQQIIKAIANGWRWIVAFVLIAACISLAISATSIPTYRSQATFIIAPNKDLPSSRDVVSAFTALDTLNIFATYTDILASERVFKEAVKAVDVDDMELSQYTRYTAMQPDSLILQLFVEGPDPQTVATMANETGKYGIQFINAYFSVFEIDFLDQAVVAERAFRPRIVRDMAVFAGFGLLIGMVVVLVKDFMEIPLSQFIHRMSMDQESMAFTKRSIEKSLVNMKEKGDACPMTFILIKIKNLSELLPILPRFSRSKLTSEVVSRMKTQIKGSDLIGRWEQSIFCVLLPNTSEKVSPIIQNKLLGVFKDPFIYGVEDTEQTALEASAATTSATKPGEIDTLIHDTEAKIANL